MTRVLTFVAILAALITVLVLRGARQGAADTGAVVDSVVPRPVALARFRAGIARTDSLAGGARSRAALINRFVEALRAADTVELAALAMTRAEFAWLYYETTPQGLPPYDLAPALLWFLIEGRSRQGLTHLLAARGGRDIGPAMIACDSAVSIEGDNRIHGPCTVGGERLFGPIIERGGRFKFVSLANRL